MPTNTQTDALHRAAKFGICGALITVVGASASLIVTGSTSVSSDDWSYPFSPRVHVLLSVVWAASHLLLLVGLEGLRRSGLVGERRSATIGIRLAVAGTAVLVVGEIASMWLAHSAEDAGPAIAVGSLFGIGTLLTAVGMLMVGVAVVRDHVWSGAGRAAPLVFGLVNLVQIGLGPTDMFFYGIVAYGIAALWLMVDFGRRVAGAATSTGSPADRSAEPGLDALAG